ncbi:MAG: hypothetical protein QE263_01925 [Vampirovibrionales bacterium]|nr:hypothetical protein [Vampirovibrionales bacterium]
MPNRDSRPTDDSKSSALNLLAELAGAIRPPSTLPQGSYQDDSPTNAFRNKYDTPLTDDFEPKPHVAMGLHPLTGLALYALNGITPIPDVHLDFRQLDLRGIRCPKEAIDDEARKLASKKLPVGSINIIFSDRTNGLDQFSLGFIKFRIKGALYIVNQEFWHFKGSIMGADYDSYDFLNRGSKHRSDVENVLTDLGSLIPGKPYRIHFHGEQPYEDTGTY